MKCALCGSTDIDVEMMLKDGENIKHRAMCEEHANALSEWWHEQHKGVEQ